MDQIKIGEFISSKRKEKNITQTELSEMLGVTDRAVSKWENGVCLPDAGHMPDLCKILNITINDLFSGEVVDMKNNEKKLEENLLEMVKKEEEQNKKIMMCELVIGLMSSITFIVLIFIVSFIVESTIIRIILFIFSFIVFIVGILVCLKLETETGYYECQKCHNKYVPKYSQVYFAMHFGTTRYMKCPQCNKKSWCKKVLSK